MEDILFSVGGPDRLLTTLRIFRDRPAIRELDVVKHLIQKDSPDMLLSKEEQINKGIVDSLREFIAQFRRDRGVGKKGGGRRTTEDQNIFDALMAAISGKSLSGKKLGRMLARHLDVSHRQMKRGRAMNAGMVDMDTKRWKRRCSAISKHAIGVGEFDLI